MPPPAHAGMRIGLLGGSFNPAHQGHLHISEIALQRLGLNQVWWLVTPANPLKNRRDLAPLAQRLSSARRLVKHPGITVTAFEASHRDAYTVNTLGRLLRRYGNVHFVWLMGADGLAGFRWWRDWRGIARRVPIAVFDRPGFRYRALASIPARVLERARLDESDARALATARPPAWTFLSIPLQSVSSTQLRETG